MERHLKIAENLAKLLDSQFGVGKFKVGLDPLIGLIPGFGDIVSALFSFYLIWIAKKLKMPQSEINKMVKYIAIDLVLGSIPFVGEVGDFFYKANKKNWDIIKKYTKDYIEDADIVV